MRRCFSAVLLLVLLPFVAVAGGEVAATDLPVESYVLVDTVDINARVAAGVEAGLEWPFDPVLVAIEFLGSTNYRYLNIERSAGKSPATTALVTVIRGGMQDDSVWGNWEQLQMSKNAAGAWEVDEARRAWRCYRGHQTNSFGKRFCL